MKKVLCFRPSPSSLLTSESSMGPLNRSPFPVLQRILVSGTQPSSTVLLLLHGKYEGRETSLRYMKFGLDLLSIFLSKYCALVVCLDLTKSGETLWLLYRQCFHCCIWYGRITEHGNALEAQGLVNRLEEPVFISKNSVPRNIENKSVTLPRTNKSEGSHYLRQALRRTKGPWPRLVKVEVVAGCREGNNLVCENWTRQNRVEVLPLTRRQRSPHQIWSILEWAPRPRCSGEMRYASNGAQIVEAIPEFHFPLVGMNGREDISILILLTVVQTCRGTVSTSHAILDKRPFQCPAN